MYTPSLPYRRLVKFANGIWDENRKTFYPFKIAHATIAGKTGIRYFVKSVSVSLYNNGDKATSSAAVSSILDGKTVYFLNVHISATVAASNVNQQNSGFLNAGVLCDSGAAITCSTGATAASYHVVYAEIPNDPAGGPVVIT